MNLFDLLTKIKELSESKGGMYALGVATSLLPCYFAYNNLAYTLEQERNINNQHQLDKKEINEAYNRGLEDGLKQFLYHSQVLDSLIKQKKGQ